MSTSEAIVIEGLKKSFKDLVVLDGISFTVKRGSVLALLGPNGAGKTTMVRILSTLLRPDSGHVLVDGHDLRSEPKKVRASIGLTGQYAAVDEYLTGRENLEMIGRLYRLSTADTTRRSRELLERFDLVEAGNRSVRTYSGGMRRRIDLAMSLVASPPILFLDEPTTGLDPRSRFTMWEIIKELAATDVTVLLTTQYMEEADYLADKIVVIDHGRVIAEGTAHELKSQVGPERLELVIALASSFEHAERALANQSLHIDSRRRAISVIVERGVSQVKDALSRLEEAGIEVESVSLHRPTLDDVFLSLTGHSATEDEQSGVAGHGKQSKP